MQSASQGERLKEGEREAGESYKEYNSTCDVNHK